jgi:hypothetical protein
MILNAKRKKEKKEHVMGRERGDIQHCIEKTYSKD